MTGQSWCLDTVTLELSSRVSRPEGFLWTVLRIVSVMSGQVGVGEGSTWELSFKKIPLEFMACLDTSVSVH